MQPPAVDLSFEDAVFLVQIGDDLLLVTLNPPGERGEQQGEDHGLSSGVQA
jgi:hypothetical protein